MARTTTNKGTNKGTTTSIINVTVNGLTVNEVINDVKARLCEVEKSVFNIALECSYALGVTIPQYIDSQGNEHASATCEKPIKKQADLLKLIGRSKQTLSRWIKAMKLVIEKGYFSDFASGQLPFSYDKIITIFENEENFKGYILADLMGMTVDTLDAMSETKSEETSEEETEETSEEVVETSEEETTEEVAKAEEETTILSYNGKEYKVVKSVFEKWLSENAIVE